MIPSEVEKRKNAVLEKMRKRDEARKAGLKTETKKDDLDAYKKVFMSNGVEVPPVTHLAEEDDIAVDSAPCSNTPVEDDQARALLAWANTMLGAQNAYHEVDLGKTEQEASQRIKDILSGNDDTGSEVSGYVKDANQEFADRQLASERLRRCRQELAESGFEETIQELVTKKQLTVRDDVHVYKNVGVQTNLLAMFLTLHPAWLKLGLEVIFNEPIKIGNKMASARLLSRVIKQKLFKNERIMKNPKFVRGTSNVTPAGHDALHRHFLIKTLTLFYVVDRAMEANLQPTFARIFNRNCSYKKVSDVLSELSRLVLSGRGMSIHRVCQVANWKSTYFQTFFHEYVYEAKKLSDFADGLIFGRLVEMVAKLPLGKLTSQMREPSDLTRKKHNVRVALDALAKANRQIDDIRIDEVVVGGERATLLLLWRIIGLNVEVERTRHHKVWSVIGDTEALKAVEDCDLKKYVLEMCRKMGSKIGHDVPDLDSLRDGVVLATFWSIYNEDAPSVEFYPGNTLFDKVVRAAVDDLRLPAGLEKSIELFADAFIKEVASVACRNISAKVIQKTFRRMSKKGDRFYQVVCEVMRRSAAIKSVEQIQNFDVTESELTITQARYSQKLSANTMTPARESSFSSNTYVVNRESTEGGRLSVSSTKPFLPTTTPVRIRKVFDAVQEEEEVEEKDYATTSSKSGEHVPAHTEDDNESIPEDVMDVEEENGVKILDCSSIPTDDVTTRTEGDDTVAVSNTDVATVRMVSPVTIERNSSSLTNDVVGSHHVEEVAPVNKKEPLRMSTTNTTVSVPDVDRSLASTMQPTLAQVISSISQMRTDENIEVSSDGLDSTEEAMQNMNDAFAAALNEKYEDDEKPPERVVLGERKPPQSRDEVEQRRGTDEFSWEKDKLAAEVEELVRKKMDLQTQQLHLKRTLEELERRRLHDDEESTTRSLDVGFVATPSSSHVEEVDSMQVKRNNAALTVQKYWKGWQVRKNLREQTEERAKKLRKRGEHATAVDNQLQQLIDIEIKKDDDVKAVPKTALQKLQRAHRLLLSDHFTISRCAAEQIARLTKLSPCFNIEFVVRLDGITALIKRVEPANKSPAWIELSNVLVTILHTFIQADTKIMMEQKKKLTIEKLFALSLRFLDLCRSDRPSLIRLLEIFNKLVVEEDCPAARKQLAFQLKKLSMEKDPAVLRSIKVLKNTMANA